MSFADLKNYKFEQLMPPYLHAEIWNYSTGSQKSDADSCS